ncbi:MAG: hypothetical protein HY721_14270 [Planctomycetes bacterium]|nr:hypothetical protein [Planctomycetota bacterium]
METTRPAAFVLSVRLTVLLGLAAPATTFGQDPIGGALYLDCGGTREVTDARGRTWQPDEPYLAPEHPRVQVHVASGTVDTSLLADKGFPQEVLLSDRVRRGGGYDDAIHYRIAAANGLYSVTFFFSENCRECVEGSLGGTGEPGANRVFRIELEEGRALLTYNPAASARPPGTDLRGATFAATEVVLHQSVIDGALDLRLLDNGGGASEGDPFVQAISIQKVSQDAMFWPALFTVQPDLILARTPVEITVTGIALGPPQQVLIGGSPLVGQEYVSPGEIRGRTPELLPGVYTVTLAVNGEAVAQLRDAVEAAPQVEVHFVDPPAVSTVYQNFVYVYGQNFRPQTVIYFGSERLIVGGGQGGFMSEQVIGGRRPPAFGQTAAPGVRDVIAEDSRGRFVLPGGVMYMEPTVPVEIRSFAPVEVSLVGGVPFEIRGQGFTPGAWVCFDGGEGADCRHHTYVDSTTITGTVPPDPMAVFSYTSPEAFEEYLGSLPRQSLVRVSDPVNGGAEAEITYLPLRALAVDPPELPAAVGGRITVTGMGFTPETRVTIAGVDLSEKTFVDARTITGFAPGLPAGAYDLVVSDVLYVDFGDSVVHEVPIEDVLQGGVTYTQSTVPIEITSFTPLEASFLGEVVFELRGKGFTPDTGVCFLGGESAACGGHQYMDSTWILGRLPPDPSGDAAYRSGQGFEEYLASLPRRGLVRVFDPVNPGDAPEVAITWLPLRALQVDPPELPAGTGGRVTVRGFGFRPWTEVTLGGLELAEKTFVDARTVTGVAPPLPAGAHDLRVAEKLYGGEDTIDHVLPRAVTYTGGPGPDTTPPGPQGIEATLAEGTARFSWSNPVPYSEIRVYQGAGEVQQYLYSVPGEQTVLEMEVPPGTDLVELTFQGVTPQAVESEMVDASALKGPCLTIPPLDLGAIVGKLDLPLYGDHAAASVARCGAGGGGGEDEADLEPRGAGAALQAEGTVGYVLPHAEIAPFVDTNLLTTAFVLEREADKLELTAHYQKLAADFGLSLRARLTHVYPADGFKDELSFPDILIGGSKDKRSVVYFRADRDPTSPAAQPCRGPDGKVLKIPKGEYLLDLYAVGGNAQTPYYAFSDDWRDNPLLIAGSPCPPYPWVEVRDLTGAATLPQVVEVRTALKQGPAGEPIGVTYTALGTWLDRESNPWSIDPGCPGCPPPPPPPYKKDPGVEYLWKIHAPGGPNGPYSVSSGDKSSVFHPVVSYGCYKVEVTALDKICGTSRTYAREVAIVPEPPPCRSPAFSFSNVNPDPGGIYAIVGLDPPPGKGSFDGVRPVRFTMLVTPPCACPGAGVAPDQCPAAQIGGAGGPDFECRIAAKDPSAPGGWRELAKLVPEDKCPNRPTGPKYYDLTLDDLGKLPEIPGADGKFADAYFQARTIKVRQPDGTVKVVADTWQNLGSPLHLTNAPQAFHECFWRGSLLGAGDFNAEQSYHFVVTSSETPLRSTAIPNSQPVSIAIPGGDPVEIPSYENGLSSGFTARFYMQKGVWKAEEGSGSALGTVLGNKLSGAPVKVKPQEVASGGGAGGGASDSSGGAGASDGSGGAVPSAYLWCDEQKIFENHFSQQLFEAILYTGTIGPIPVTVWASIGLGLDTLVKSRIAVSVSPFGPLAEGSGSFVETHFYLFSSIELSLPAEIRADILFGIASLAARLIPSATFQLDTHVFSEDLSADAEVFIQAFFKLDFAVKACLFKLLCYTLGPYELFRADLIPPQGTDFRSTAKSCSGGAGGGLAEDALEAAPPGGEAGGAGTGGGVSTPVTSFSTGAPSTALSPDGKTAIDCWIADDGTARVQINSSPNTVPYFPFGPNVLELRDPQAVFLSNAKALIAWTASTYYLAPGYPFRSPQDTAEQVAQSNALLAQEEVAVSPVTYGVSWSIGSGILISDGIARDPSERRADGKAAVAADLGSEEALVAWVRYETQEMLVIDGTKTLPVPEKDPVSGKDVFVQRTVPNVRPQLEQTAIYARRANLAGGVGPARRLSRAGINIEPAIAVSPSGAGGFCVWVHDSTPGHVNLIDSNRGRSLLYSVYSKAGDSWSAPRSVLADPRHYDERYPGILEPFLALKGDGEGLLAFTALPSTASVKDTGLWGGSRLVYACRLQGGAFGEPFLIHGKCGKRIYGHSVWIHNVPDLTQDPGIPWKKPRPEWYAVFEGGGPILTRAGAGDILVATLEQGSSVWSPPVILTPDDHGHSSLAAAAGQSGLRTVHWDAGPAKLLAGAGGGLGSAGSSEGAGAGAGESGFVVLETALDPDPAVAGCSLSESFPAPGSPVTAKVEVENRGLAGTPLDRQDRSAVGLVAVFVDEDGMERVVASAAVPPLAPGEAQVVELAFEMPLDPVRLKVALDPSPLDRDASNNDLERFLGAPDPQDLTCKAIAISDEARTLAAEISWSNPVLYDEVWIYREGSMLATVPGSSTSYVDLGASSGWHTYFVRGRVGPSKSRKVPCQVDLSTRPPEPRFRLSFRGPSTLQGLEGDPVLVDLKARLHTEGLDRGQPGAQAWSLSVRSEGCEVAAATTAGTAGADRASGGLRSGGFERTEITRGPGNLGAVSEVVLSYSEPVTLPPEGSPHDVLALKLEGVFPPAAPGCAPCSARFEGGLAGSEGPVENLVTYGGALYRPSVEAWAVRLCGTPRLEAGFRRGDANSDRRVNISDAIATFGYLFLGSAEPLCLDAADADDTGRVDITDGIYVLNFLFLGGRPIPAPGPEACGLDPRADGLAACKYPRELCE